MTFTDAMLTRADMTHDELHESAIKALMLMGRTREEAERELREAEENRLQRAEREWWNQ